LASSETFKTHLEEILSFLATARPTAVNLSGATTRLSRTFHSLHDEPDTRIIAKELIAEGKLIADEDVGRNKEMSRHGAEWLLQYHQNSENFDPGLNVLTVCNTGSLATSVSYHGALRLYSPFIWV
jgi:methylthioribose-1-phosphate isomerase